MGWPKQAQDLSFDWTAHGTDVFLGRKPGLLINSLILMGDWCTKSRHRPTEDAGALNLFACHYSSPGIGRVFLCLRLTNCLMGDPASYVRSSQIERNLALTRGSPKNPKILEWASFESVCPRGTPFRTPFRVCVPGMRPVCVPFLLLLLFSFAVIFQNLYT